MEIDDQELINLRSAKALLDRLQKPETKRDFDKIVRKHHPEYSPPPSREEFEELEKSRDDFIKAAIKSEREAEAKERAEKKFQADIDALRLSKENPDGYTEEGVQEIIKLMKDRTIPDVEAARALFEKQNPPKPEPPAGFAGTSWGFGQAAKEDTDKRLLYSDPDAWADQEAINVINGLKRGQTFD